MSSTPPPEHDADEPVEAGTAASTSLFDRWWWSAALWMVVGVGVIAYQSGPIRDGNTIGLTWVMVAVGALVAARGVMMLWTSWKAQGASSEPVDPS